MYGTSATTLTGIGVGVGGAGVAVGVGVGGPAVAVGGSGVAVGGSSVALGGATNAVAMGVTGAPSVDGWATAGVSPPHAGNISSKTTTKLIHRLSIGFLLLT